jgi:RNA polymerase sigma factor (sigma-70 family)
MQPVVSNAGSSAAPAAQGGQPPAAPQLVELVRAMACGDPAALSAIYEQTVAQVFAISRSMLRSKEDAEDASRGTVTAWLAVMARNRAVDRLRQRRALLSLDDERHAALAASVAGEALDPEQVLRQFQSGSAVHRALRSLSAQRRYLLGLAFFQGLSHQEIADTTGTPLGTVKSHLRRALAALQGELTVDE